ncbi:hypothetical protein Tco_0689435 [Tanacetum coccineum]
METLQVIDDEQLVIHMLVDERVVLDMIVDEEEMDDWCKLEHGPHVALDMRIADQSSHCVRSSQVLSLVEAGVVEVPGT